jgi:hypothetical protein
VLGLTADEFILLDNGVPQSVEAVSLDSVPLDLTLLLTSRAESVQFDTSAGQDSGSSLIRGLDSIAVVRRLLLAEDRLRVVFVNCEIYSELVPREVPLGRAKFLAPPWGPRCNLRIRLADGIFYALAWPVPADRRHLVVVFADGWDTGSALEVQQLPRLAANSDAVMHAVLWAPQGPSVNYYEQRRNMTSDPAIGLAVEQSGGAILKAGDVDVTLRQILADYRTSYLLRYVPREVPSVGWHELAVSLRRPGNFTIRARRGYEGH